MEFQEQKARRVHKVQRVRLGRWVHKVFRDQLVRMEFQEQKAHRVRQARKVSLAPRA
jgi:hypothetical protein